MFGRWTDGWHQWNQEVRLARFIGVVVLTFYRSGKK